MKDIWIKIKKIGSWIIALSIITLVIVPWIFLYYYLRKQKKTIIIYPKFKVVDIKTKGEENINKDALRRGLEAGEEILRRCKAIDKRG